MSGIRPLNPTKGLNRTGLPVSLAMLVLNTSQMLVRSAGLNKTGSSRRMGTPVQWSFCVNAVVTGGPYVIPDAARSEQAANPLVAMDGIASFAGVPLVVHGHVIRAQTDGRRS